jgi:hypothetical protein
LLTLLSSMKDPCPPKIEARISWASSMAFKASA